ncbi:unnamed protein product [Protopolystoma xenopodis]|uniref:Uncharacterized protein n=1 Tax=Protopolystoma xenopodis TaxID=117903 RepID=A0A3S5CUY8_9PLAT|nr:unnamed protein product [Protopolystoma xenopodis]
MPIICLLFRYQFVSVVSSDLSGSVGVESVESDHWIPEPGEHRFKALSATYSIALGTRVFDSPLPVATS